MLGFHGNYTLTRHLAILTRQKSVSIRKLRARKLPGVFQKRGAYMLELVVMEGVDERGKIAQSLTDTLADLLRDFCARECCGPSHMEKAYPM